MDHRLFDDSFEGVDDGRMQDVKEVAGVDDRCRAVMTMVFSSEVGEMASTKSITHWRTSLSSSGRSATPLGAAVCSCSVTKMSCSTAV